MLGLLATAEGHARGEDITDLVGLTMGVRVDQAGSLLRDYHTVSDHRGGPLPSTQVNAKGEQKNTSPAKPTYVTQRFYLQDAVFVSAHSVRFRVARSSPQTRGWPHRSNHPQGETMLVPAAAGMDRCKGIGLSGLDSRPRRCGGGLARSDWKWVGATGKCGTAT